MRDSDTRTVKIRLGIEMPLKLLAKEVRALAYCNRALRRQLLPILFADFAMGGIDDDKPNDDESEKTASLASTGDEPLACVRSVLASLPLYRLPPASYSSHRLKSHRLRTLNLGTLTPRGVEVACDCIAVSLSPIYSPFSRKLTLGQHRSTLAEDARSRDPRVDRAASHPFSNCPRAREGPELYDGRAASL